VKRAADVELLRAAADLVRARDGVVDAGHRAGEHDLAGSVVVGEREAELLLHGEHVVALTAKHGDHPAGLAIGRVGHRFGARLDETDGILELDRAGGRQRGVLAERVAGGGERRRAVTGCPLAHRAQKQRGLMAAGAVGEALERVEAQQLDPALQQRVVAVRLLHAHGMASLSRKEQCGGGMGCSHSA